MNPHWRSDVQGHPWLCGELWASKSRLVWDLHLRMYEDTQQLNNKEINAPNSTGANDMNRHCLKMPSKTANQHTRCPASLPTREMSVKAPMNCPFTHKHGWNEWDNISVAKTGKNSEHPHVAGGNKNAPPHLAKLLWQFARTLTRVPQGRAARFLCAPKRYENTEPHKDTHTLVQTP